MERTKKILVKQTEPEVKEQITDNRLRWQKTGGGRLYWKNHIIKPGEIFLATREELPVSFMDTIICLEKDKEEVLIKKERVEQTTIKQLYTIVKVDEDKFNLVSKSGKVLNEIPLSEEDAKELKKALEE